MAAAVLLSCGGAAAAAAVSVYLVSRSHSLAELAFPIAYRVYTSRLGWYMHQSVLSSAKDSEPHTTVPSALVGEDSPAASALAALHRKRMAVHVVPMLSDNYAYIVVDEERKEAVAVDPSDPQAVQSRLKSLGVTLIGILTTHYHWDHAGGNWALAEEAKKEGRQLVIAGSAETKQQNASSCVNRVVRHAEVFRIGRLCFSALSTKGHTQTDVTFLLHHQLADPVAGEDLQRCLTDTTSWSLFTGDVLFGAGCGKFFELPPSAMYSALKRLACVHQSQERCTTTLVWPGHEYALSNCRFSAKVEPANAEIAQRLANVEHRRQLRLPTVPSTLQEELDTNLFLRCAITPPECLPLEDAIAKLADLRKQKNEFKA